MPPHASDLPPDSQPARPGTKQFGWRLPFSGRAARRAAWRHMLLHDEGLVRLAFLNLHRVSAQAWRSAQPNPWQLAAFARRGGRTVVSLRNGRNFGSLPLELEACHRLGLAFHVAVFRSRRLPSVEDLRAFEALLQRIEYPVLFHCKSGADRSGFAAALYLMLVEDRPAAEARRQLSLRYGHLSGAATGVLDAFFHAYERDTAETPMPLMEWVETRYDRQAIAAAFRPRRFARWLVDRLLARE